MLPVSVSAQQLIGVANDYESFKCAARAVRAEIRAGRGDNGLLSSLSMRAHVINARLKGREARLCGLISNQVVLTLLQEPVRPLEGESV